MVQHLEHLEDLIFDFRNPEALVDLVNFLSRPDFLKKTSMKYDGSPSVVFGTDPETNKRFVSTKSYFNKQPVMAFTDEDIKEKFTDAIFSPMKSLLAAIKTIDPGVILPIVQGDLMWWATDPRRMTIQPNTIEYVYTGEKAWDIGVCVHTFLGGMANKAYFDVGSTEQLFDNYKAITGSGHIEIFGGLLGGLSPTAYNNRQNHDVVANALITHAVKDIQKTHSRMQPTPHFNIDQFRLSQVHPSALRSFVNETIRSSRDTKSLLAQINVDNYLTYLEQVKVREVGLRKTHRGKLKILDKYQGAIHDVNRGGSTMFHDVFDIWHQLYAIKIHAISYLDITVSYMENGLPLIPNFGQSNEGYVIADRGTTVKLVNRADFSAANFTKHKKKVS